MPLYEYLCEACNFTFEALRSISASNQDTECPECRADARRILSPANFGGPGRDLVAAERHKDGVPDVTSLKLPPAAQLCWMDNQSGARLAAYKCGRGAEYDDTVAVRSELAAKRGESDPLGAAPSNSPLANPVTFANRRKAAEQAKVIESAAIKKNQPTS
jgi:putative FmdB family regulatory protein